MLKRLFDIFISGLGLVLLSPLLFLVALAITIDSRGPVFYRGPRIGYHEKSFSMLKFRTMVTNADKIGGPTTADDDPRITRVGTLLRKYKLDEFPQLINVVKGQMSLVGPRPDVKEVIDLLSVEDKKIIFSVRPGITDFASLEFPNEGELVKGAKDAHQAYVRTILPTKVKLQKKYIKEQTFLLDIRIILKTLKTIIS
jgi:lipopolysaccharide/colanic/teichoic acid biosynthesis glycosyltransferase